MVSFRECDATSFNIELKFEPRRDTLVENLEVALQSFKIRVGC